MSRRCPLARVLVLALLPLGVACKDPSPGTDDATPEPPSARAIVRVDPALIDDGRVTILAVSKRSPTTELGVGGEVVSDPEGAAHVSAVISARVTSIAVREGDTVSRGDVLAELEAPDAARVARDLALARARKVRAEKVLAQEETLLAQKATSERSVIEARAELAAARADESGARSLLASFGGGSKRLTLKAPIAGTVVHRDIELGEQVDAGRSCFRIVNKTSLYVRADVPESEAGSVELDAAALVSGMGASATCRGSVKRGAGTVERRTRTVAFRVELGEGCDHLIDGAFVDVTLERKARGDTELIAVPRDAVVELDSVPTVFVPGASKGEFRAVPVTVAVSTRRTAYVADGLAADARVVTRGAILLKGEWMRALLE
ncbi:MAG: efflux RND transporter periplasmic adaptor subunit [Polyangiaceae bacterium]|nr:efflux RND transporter periplasmic adaptor subunit [Polyangiaceae bacterium]